MGKPDPECKWCHGTGEIRLIVTTVPCDCVKCDCKGRSGGEVIEDCDDDCNDCSGDCHI